MKRTTNHYRRGSFGARFRSQLAAQTRHQNQIPDLTPREQELVDQIQRRVRENQRRGINMRGECTALAIYTPPCTALTIYEPPVDFKPPASAPIDRPLVDWSQTTMMPRPHNPKRRERFYAVRCSKCDGERWLRAFDARRVEQGTRTVCARCQSQAAGSKGYAATRALYGDKWAVECLQAYLLDHPRPTMQAVADILDELGIPHEREYWLEDGGNVFLIDAMLPGNKAIEADGTYVHSLEKQRLADECKRAVLAARGYELLVVTDQDVAAGRAEAMIRDYAGMGFDALPAGLCEDRREPQSEDTRYEDVQLPIF